MNRLGGLSLPRNSVVMLTDCPKMTIAIYRGRKATPQLQLMCTETGQACFGDLVGT